MSNYEIVRQAIIDRRQIVAVYNGYTREMCPHVIGLKNGEENALFYQFAGDSSKGLPPEGEWRCIKIAGLSNVSVREGPWYTAANHSRPQTCVDIDQIDQQISY